MGKEMQKLGSMMPKRGVAKAEHKNLPDASENPDFFLPFDEKQNYD